MMGDQSPKEVIVKRLLALAALLGLSACGIPVVPFI